MKESISGIVSNVSSNPFQTFSSKRSNSTIMTFDISFDICDEEGSIVHVWFNRSLRLPPPLEDGDYIEAYGRYGRFFGLIGKKNFYAMRISDPRREKEYTCWRNIDFEEKSVSGRDRPSNRAREIG